MKPLLDFIISLSYLAIPLLTLSLISGRAFANLNVRRVFRDRDIKIHTEFRVYGKCRDIEGYV